MHRLFTWFSGIWTNFPGLPGWSKVGKRHECKRKNNADDSIWFDMIWLVRLLASLDFKALVHHLRMRGCTGVPSNLSFTLERGHPQEGLGQKEKTRESIWIYLSQWKMRTKIKIAFLPEEMVRSCSWIFWYYNICLDKGCTTSNVHPLNAISDIWRPRQLQALPSSSWPKQPDLKRRICNGAEAPRKTSSVELNTHGS